MTDIKSDGNEILTAGNAMSDAEVLRYAAGQVEDLADLVRGKLEAIDRRLIHQDDLIHGVDRNVAEIRATLEKYRPLLERYADPGKAVRKFITGRKEGK